MPKPTDKRLARLKAAKAEADERKGWAWEHAAEVYRERDLLVAALARCYPSHVMAAGKDRAAICIHTPAGQLAWMFPMRSEGTVQANSGTLHDCLSDLPTTPNDWDKAKAADRYARLEKLAKTPRLTD